MKKSKITPAQFTARIETIAEEIKKLIKEAGYPSGYFTFAIVDGCVMFNNEYFGKDRDFPINFPM